MPHPFIPAILDDAELSPAQFRVYCHIARRAGSTGVCYASLQSMADTTHLKRQTIQEAINKLVKRGMLLETKTNRQTRHLSLAKTGPFGASLENPTGTIENTPAKTGTIESYQLVRSGTPTGTIGVLQRFSPKVLPLKGDNTSTPSTTHKSTVPVIKEGVQGEPKRPREPDMVFGEDRLAWVARQPL